MTECFPVATDMTVRWLFSGDISAYASHSEADIALVAHLAYWTNGDAWRIDSLFRQSVFMRDKWNEKHEAQTYGERTIALVLRDFQPYVKIPRITASFSTVLKSSESKHKAASITSIFN